MLDHTSSRCYHLSRPRLLRELTSPSRHTHRHTNTQILYFSFSFDKLHCHLLVWCLREFYVYLWEIMTDAFLASFFPPYPSNKQLRRGRVSQVTLSSLSWFSQYQPNTRCQRRSRSLSFQNKFQGQGEAGGTRGARAAEETAADVDRTQGHEVDTRPPHV